MQVSGKEFDRDPYSGKPKILFIGLPHSTHTQSWIDLLTGSEFNIRLFGVPAGYPPPTTWRVRTYVTISGLPKGLEPDIRCCLHPTPEEQCEYQVEYQGLEDRRRELQDRQRELQDRRRELQDRRWRRLRRNPVYWGFALTRKGLDRVGSVFGMPRLYQELRWVPAFSEDSIMNSLLLNEIPPLSPPHPKAVSAEAWLAHVIQEWQPDIIHTLGLDHDQGGFFYYGVRKTFGLEKYGKWVLQLRGGSDLTLNRHDPEMAVRISDILKECDRIICDNTRNIAYAEEMGVPRDKFADIVPIPGTGGIDLDGFSGARNVMPSQRERIILWPKAYNCPWSVALPVYEALKIAWDRIKPCKIHMLAMTPDARMWFNALPPDIRRHCHVHDRIPRQEVLFLMQQSRVMLAPSLVDGIPNSLYEAMAAGAFPIVSPLETIASVVQNERNVLFARNLYPDEIAQALERSMTDSMLVDTAAQQNYLIVQRLADRALTGPRVVAFYKALAAQ